MKIPQLEDNPAKVTLIAHAFPDDDITVCPCWKDYQRELHSDTEWDVSLLDVNVPMFAGDFPKDMGNASRSEARRQGFTGLIVIISTYADTVDLKGDDKTVAYTFGDTQGWTDEVNLARAFKESK